MANIPTGIEISRIPISTLAMIFVSYLAIHIAIAVIFKKKKEELCNIHDKESKEYIEIFKTVKKLKLLYNWFPAIVIIFIVIGFYL